MRTLMAQSANNEVRKANAAAYGAIVETYVRGLMRIWGARAVQLTLKIALFDLHGNAAEHPPEAGEQQRALKELGTITYRDFDAFDYVGDFSHLVYATTVLDTFLTDTTRFLFLIQPASIGESKFATVKDIVAAKSTAELLKAVVDKRAKALSYESFLTRIDFLRKHYGLRLALDTEARVNLKHFSDIRHVMIHDQGHFDFNRSADGRIELVGTACPNHPKPVDSAQIKGALNAYNTVVASLAKAVFRDVLLVDVPEFLLPPLRAAVEGTDATAPTLGL
jgi:hypothetical protein